METAELQQRGFGIELGFGKSPAILVIDMMRAFTNPHLPLGTNLGKIRALSEAKLEEFYTLATSYAVRDTNSRKTTGFRTWMEEKYVGLIKAEKI